MPTTNITRRAMGCRHHGHRLAMSLVEVLIVATLTSILCGIAMSLLVGLRDWDRGMREHSQQSEQLIRLGEIMRADIRQASDVSQLSPGVLNIRNSTGQQVRYELAPEGCSRAVSGPEKTNSSSDLYAVGPASSWKLTPGPDGNRPMYTIMLDRGHPNDQRRIPPLLVHAIVGVDAVPQVKE